MTRILAGFAAAMLFPLLAAQVPLGAVPPAPSWQTWLQGDPVELVDGKRPACTLFAFYTPPRAPGLFVAEGDYLAELQQRFAARGLAVVAVVGEQQPAPLERWPQCRVVVDAELATTVAWFADLEGTARAMLIDRSGKVVFQGAAESGLVDAIERVLGGKDLDGFGAAAMQRAEMLVNYQDTSVDQIAGIERALVQVPHDGVLLGFLYLLRAVKAEDAVAAKLVLQRGIAALAGEARPLAAFADLVLRGDPGRAEALAELRAPLQAAAKRASHDPAVQLALLRLLVQAGDGREAGRQAMRMRKVAMGTVDDCLDFASILTLDREPLVHRDLATLAVQTAEALGGSGRFVTAARYAVARRCANDAAGAKRLLDEYVDVDSGGSTQAKADGSTLNNDCWYLMTEVSTMGRFSVFAAGLAERMLEDRDALDAAAFDTVALALFLSGRTAEAVELEETAIQRGGNGNPEYAKRLARYRAAAASPVR